MKTKKCFAWLWAAGRPMPPRLLHHQLLLSREISVIPRFLLESRFWTDHLSCTQACCCPKAEIDSRGSAQECGQRLWKCALGFLFSYAALIAHESDFYLPLEPTSANQEQYALSCAR